MSRAGVRPFDVESFMNFIVKPSVAAPRFYLEMLNTAQLKFMKLSGYVYFITVEGEIALCGGVTPRWGNRCEAFAFLDQELCRKHVFAVHRIVKHFLDAMAMQFNRIEATVEVGFIKGEEWVESLGFELEAPCMRNYTPDGKAYSLYARIS